MSTDIIKATTHAVLKPHGFRRKGNSWYKFSDECIVVFNLQHSFYSKMYYVNLAADFFKTREASSPEYPKEYQCSFRMRLPDLNINEDSFFDLEYPMEDDVREKQLKIILENYCIPLLDKLASLDGIISLYNKYPYLDTSSYKLSALLKLRNSAQ